MIDLEPVIETIETLLKEDSCASLTYAALECRLALERICYDRLRTAHDYISHADLKRWQPRDVVNILIKEVDPNCASSLTMSIARDHMPCDTATPTREDYEGYDWVEVGTQIGFDPNRIGKLWNALSSVALHTKLPATKSDDLARYGNLGAIRDKVVEALEEIKRCSKSTLLSSGLGTVLSFECVCGTQNKRRTNLLRDGATISCISSECRESYIYSEAECEFERRVFPVQCKVCDKEYWIPRRCVEELRIGQRLTAKCSNCGKRIFVEWRPMQTQGD